MRVSSRADVLDRSSASLEVPREPGSHAPILAATGEVRHGQSLRQLSAAQHDGCIQTALFDVDRSDGPALTNRRYTVWRVAAGHFMHQELPEAFNVGLLTWLKRHHG